MSREDQINVELAGRIDAVQQKAALTIKNTFLSDERVAILTDDEAIIAAGNVYGKLAKHHDTTQNICLAVGFGGMIISILGQSFGPLIVAIPLAFAYYYFAWTRRKEGAGAEILDAFFQAGDSKKARIEIAQQANSSPVLPDQNVQEQATTAPLVSDFLINNDPDHPLTSEPASVFEKPKRD